MSIKNSVVLITGANRGIGKAYVESFLAAGADKIYLGVRKPDSVAKMVAQNPEKLVPLKLDVTNENDIKEAASAAQDVTILINNAGILFFDGIETPEAADHARKQFETNYIGPLRMTQAFAPILKKNGGGILITVSSIAGHVAFPGFTTYCASKFAARSLILEARAQLAAQGTRVIGVYPGPIETDMTKDIQAFDKAPVEAVPQETLKCIAEGVDEVYTDPMAKELHEALLKDPSAVEAQMQEMAQESQEAA
ncbi:MAG: SDR family oxidoreductase [Alphaproteobacteria bacterium]|nr:SDR family oxidoreductase [Alphaproteobacteria bacterium]